MSTISRRRYALLLATALGSLSTAAAAGQVERAPAPAPAPSPTPTPNDSVQETAPVINEERTANGDVIVTARRRNERLLDVPVSVTALGVEQIQRYRADNLANLTETVPTVSIASYRANAGGTLTIRGIGTPASQGGFEQAVSLVIDGVPVSSARLVMLGFFDMQQVEILKGPQALFFGKNSPAGVISLTSLNPTKSFEGQARIAYEFVGDEATIDGIVAGPITEKLSARIALRYRNLQGWLYNDARPIANPFNSAAPLPGAIDKRTGERELLGRVSLRYDNGPFDVTLKLAGQKLYDDGPTSQNIGPCPTGKPQVFVSNVLATDPYGECKPDNHYSAGAPSPVTGMVFSGYQGDGQLYGHYRQALISLNANYDFGDMVLSSTSGYVHWNQQTFYGFDQTVYSTLITYDSERANIYSQELRLSSKLEGPLNFMIGGFYQHSNNPRFTDLQLTPSTNTALTAGSGLCYNPTRPSFSCYTKIATISGSTLSGFGQLILKPSPRLEIAGGVRFTRENKDTDQTQVYGRGNFDVSATVIPGSLSSVPGRIIARFRDTNWSPEATVSYHPTGNSTIYAAYKTAYKSGGFGNSGPFTRAQTTAAISFGPENVKGFEVGAKGRFGQLRVEGTAFAYQFQQLQVNTFDASTTTFRIANAGEVRQRGFDLQAEYTVTAELSVRGAIAYTHNRFRDFVGQCYNYRYPTGSTRAQLAGAPAGTVSTAPSGCQFANASALTLIQNFEGRAPARSPDWAGNFGASFSRPIGAYSFNLNGDAIYSGSYFPGETMAPGTRQPAFWKLNTSAQLLSPDKSWDVSLVGRNLTNEYVVVFAAERSNGLGAVLSPNEYRGVVARGREITLQASYHF